MYEDVMPFFKMLREMEMKDHEVWNWDKTVVGIITNSDDRVTGILESFGLKIGSRRVCTSDQRHLERSLDDDISFVILSYDVGFEKPDRRMFDSATDMLRQMLAVSHEGLKVDDFEKIYVGDELQKDYNGARDAGWSGLLLDRSSTTATASKASHRQLAEKTVQDKNGASQTVLTVTSLQGLSEWRPNQI